MSGEDLLDRRDPRAVARTEPVLRALSAWFRPEVRGLDHIPDTGPALLVANHSGGYYMPDVGGLLAAWIRRFGPERPLYSLGFDLLFAVPGLRSLLPQIGTIPACPANARAALERGATVLVYPGGDKDDCRAWRDRHHIDLAHHTGFVRLALEAQVPVVPIVTHGSQETVVVLTRGDRLSPVLRLDKLRIKVCPIILAPPWGITSIIAPYLPLPAKVTTEVLEPVDWRGLPVTDETVEGCYAEIVAMMQDALDRLAQRPALPLIDRPPRRRRARIG